MATDQSGNLFWKVIIADDEDDVHNITQLIFDDYLFEGKKIKFLSAFSGRETNELIEKNPDTAIVLLDVVMEEDNSGLQVIDYIRKTLKNKLVRIILRTGQPGQAPEERIIREYDINDYKSKTELTSQKLFTTVTSALRSYRDLKTIDFNRKSLENIIFYSNQWLEIQTEQDFAGKSLEQLSELLQLDSTLTIQTSCFATGKENEDYRILSATGELKQWLNKNLSELPYQDYLSNIMTSIKEKHIFLNNNVYIKYFTTQSKLYNILYLKTSQPLSDDKQHLISIFTNNISLAFDNSSLFKKLKETLLKSEESNRMKSEFLSIVSHELRTPLTPIIGYSKMLCDTDDLTPTIKDYMETIYRSGLKLSQVLGEIIEMSNIENHEIGTHFSPFYIREILSDIFIMLKDEILKRENEFIMNNIELNLIYSDPTKIKQILFHLISNANKFTEKGKIFIEVKASDTEYFFSVRDNGIGISKVHQKMIFEKFRQVENILTRKYEGIGLGLSICKRFSELLGGRIELQSELEKGSEFRVILPRSKEKEIESESI